MSSSTPRVRSRVIAGAVVGLVLPACAACVPYVDLPVQASSRSTDGATSAPVPERTSGHRLDFGDEYGGEPEVQLPRSTPDRERSLNRMDFRDNCL
jgi:hypothetical protein